VFLAPRLPNIKIAALSRCRRHDQQSFYQNVFIFGACWIDLDPSAERQQVDPPRLRDVAAEIRPYRAAGAPIYYMRYLSNSLRRASRAELSMNCVYFLLHTASL
jgi:hypothetical protein